MFFRAASLVFQPLERFWTDASIPIIHSLAASHGITGGAWHPMKIVFSDEQIELMVGDSRGSDREKHGVVPFQFFRPGVAPQAPGRYSPQTRRAPRRKRSSQ